MNYESERCKSCGEIMHEGEDIVVCPVCATPQHRECWMKNGHCVNEELHGSGFVWEKGKSESATSENTTENEQRDCSVCHICGSENPEDALHCGNCGALLGEAQTDKKCPNCGKQNDPDAVHCNQCGMPLDVAAGGFFAGNPYLAGTDIDENEMIGENKAGELAVFVQTSSKNYMPKFKKLAEGKKTFNWAAFIFSPYWFFYRKLYKPGIAFIAIFATAMLVFSGLFSQEMTDFMNTYASAAETLQSGEVTEEEYLEIEKKLEEAMKKAAVPVAVTVGANLIIKFICGLIANKLYYKKIIDDMKLINDSVREENLRRMMIARRGGVSVFGFAISLTGYNVVIELLASAANAISNMF